MKRGVVSDDFLIQKNGLGVAEKTFFLRAICVSCHSISSGEKKFMQGDEIKNTERGGEHQKKVFRITYSVHRLTH